MKVVLTILIFLVSNLFNINCDDDGITLPAVQEDSDEDSDCE